VDHPQVEQLAGALLEGRDGLPDRGVLLVLVSLFPPYHEVGALWTELRHGEHRSENRSSARAFCHLPIGRTASISSLPAPDNLRADFDLEGSGSVG
jgi:hypothetical protein